MPLTGIATFARAPYVPPDALQPGDAHFAVFGVPFDAAVGFRPGQRLAPRAIRDLSTRYAPPWGPGNLGYWDIQDDRWYLKGCRLVGAGDADPLDTDLEHLDRGVVAVIGRIPAAGAVPVVLGGDHSITYPVLRVIAPAFAPGGPWAGRRLHILQIDAHLDFSDAVAGYRRSNSSPFRRAAELPLVGTVTVSVDTRRAAGGLSPPRRQGQRAAHRGQRLRLASALPSTHRSGGHSGCSAGQPCGTVEDGNTRKEGGRWTARRRSRASRTGPPRAG